LSTKWRRSKKHSKWSSTIKDLEEARSKDEAKALQIRNSIKGRLQPHKFRLPKIHDKREWKAPKPLIDILQEKDWITIVAELAGFDKETLKINVTNQKLIISARSKDRKYYKSLNLPKVVIPNNVHTKYKNGVLEIKLKKAAERKTINKISGLENAT
jgi:HSP20 family molecular chaperone IbpA